MVCSVLLRIATGGGLFGFAPIKVVALRTLRTGESNLLERFHRVVELVILLEFWLCQRFHFLGHAFDCFYLRRKAMDNFFLFVFLLHCYPLENIMNSFEIILIHIRFIKSLISK